MTVCHQGILGGLESTVWWICADAWLNDSATGDRLQADLYPASVCSLATQLRCSVVLLSLNGVLVIGGTLSAEQYWNDGQLLFSEGRLGAPFSSFDTYLAPCARIYVELPPGMGVDRFIRLQRTSRWGTQTPFTNLTFDWVCPEDLREQVPVIGGNAVTMATCKRKWS